MRRSVLTGGLAAAAVVLAGCTNSASGQSTGVPATSTGGTSGGTSVVSSTAPSSVDLATLNFSNDQLCQLLTGAEAEQLGGGSTGTPSTNVVTAFPFCSWTDKTNFGISFSPTNRAEDLKKPSGSTTEKTTVAGLSGVTVDNPNDPALCQVGLDLSDHTSIVFYAGVHDTYKSQFQRCDVARTMATIVIPKIRKG